MAIGVPAWGSSSAYGKIILARSWSLVHVSLFITVTATVYRFRRNATPRFTDPRLAIL